MIYATYGKNCGHMRFKRLQANRYQRVKRFLLVFWRPVGPVIYEDDCNYFPLEGCRA